MGIEMKRDTLRSLLEFIQRHFTAFYHSLNSNLRQTTAVLTRWLPAYLPSTWEFRTVARLRLIKDAERTSRNCISSVR